MKYVIQFAIALVLLFLQVAAISACVLDQQTAYNLITQTKGN